MKGVSLFLGFIIPVLALGKEVSTFRSLQDECGFAPLCSTSPTFVAPPSLTMPAELGLDPCCTLADTQPIPPGNCPVDPTGAADRYVATDGPVCEGGECEECSTEQVMVMTMAFKPSPFGPSGCCDTCSCFGDPNCISFDGEADIWILCDGRTAPNNPGDRCVIRKSTCDEQLDHDNNACKWIGPEKSSDKVQARAENDWSVTKLGSPCVPNPESGPAEFLMYSADSFSLAIFQGERGFIESTKVAVSGSTYELDAITCFETENPWLINGEQGDLPEWIARSTSVRSPEVLWSIRDPTTGISVRIRCTANFLNGKKYIYRLNVEELAEPDPNYRQSRQNLDGYCVTNTLPKTGTWEYTQALIDNDTCEGNLETSNQQRLWTSRAICDNPAVTMGGVDECLYNFCKQYFLYQGAWKNPDECYKKINTSPWKRNQVRDAFCKTIAGDQYDECVADVDENEGLQGEGFQVAYAKYIVSPDSPDEENCEDGNDWPITSLNGCESGVLLQYKNSNGVWVTYKAFPNDVPVCGAVGGAGILHFNCKRDKVLFENEIRFYQKVSPEECQIDICNPTDGLQVFIEYGSPTTRPTNADIPTNFPVSIPPSTESSNPTLEPTSSPTTSIPTSSPTAAPTNYPTCAPIYENEGCIMDFTKAEITENELGNGGKLVFKDVCTYMGEKVSLVVSEVSGTPSYKQPTGTSNKIIQDYAAIYLDCDEEAELLFSFTDSNGNPITLAMWDLTFVEVKKTTDGSQQIINLMPAELFEDDFTSLSISTNENTGTEIKGTMKSDSSEVPNSPTKLSPEQRKCAVTARYQNSQSTLVHLENKKNCNAEYRVFYFAGTSSLADCMAAPWPSKEPVRL